MAQSQGHIILALALVLATTTCLLVALVSRQSIGQFVTDSQSQDYKQTFASEIKDWASRLGQDIYEGTSMATCMRTIREAYLERGAQVEVLDLIRMHSEMIQQISDMMNWHRKAVESIARNAEYLAGNHSFIKGLHYEYVDVHRLRGLDEPRFPTDLTQVGWASAGGDEQNTTERQQQQQPINDPSSSAGFNQQTPSQYPASSNGGSPVPGPAEWQTPFRYLPLTRHKNFAELAINFDLSAVHLPVPVYPGQQEIMNGIMWSEGLNKVFKDNMVRNPRLTNQYFASYLGFLRTYPAHKWRIARSEPDLYDARMRPWYVAGISSPKDLVILVDSSGSMTGLRREIAKGVVFEILDTLTDNDYFSILKFSETVTPVGLPRCAGLKPPRMGATMASHCSMNNQVMLDNKQRFVCNNYREQQQHQILYKQNQLKLKKAKQLLQQQQQQSNTKSGKLGQPDLGVDVDVDVDQMLDSPDNQALLDEIGAEHNQGYVYSATMANITSDLEAALMLPATGRNIRHIKGNFSITTSGIANFTHALTAAFELLQSYNRTGELGSQCNQAIMLITDGAPDENFQDIFNRYNYPDKPIRLFSYVIGREVGDINPTRLMACNNRGYYTHVINLSEVREQVQQYLPVMSRPLVLWKQHPVVWTAAYGDETYQLLSDWVWESKRRERAKIILSEERDRLNMEASNETYTVIIILTGIKEYDEIPQVDEELKRRFVCEDKEDDLPSDDEFDPLGYNDMDCHWQTKRADLLTSVVQPVFNQKNETLFFERVLQKNIWIEREKMVYNAQLLGIASVDIRIADLMGMAPSHKLGPNAYPVLVTNNGYIISHPNLRALLEDPTDRQSRILKPFFASVDLSHVELTVREGLDKERPYEFSRRILALRDAVVKRLTGYDTFMTKRPIDCQKRAQTRNQTFYYGPIKDTPFSFLIALPQPYGLYRVKAQIDLKRTSGAGSSIVSGLPKPLASYFKPSEYDIWTVHPDYSYCDGSVNNSVSTILDLLQRVESGKLDEIQWRHSSSNPPLVVPGKLTCDKDLLQSLMFDAVVTYDRPDSICGAPTVNLGSSSNTRNCDRGESGDQPSFYDSLLNRRSEQDGQSCRLSSTDMRHRLVSMYGIELSFIATRSGLTRVRVYDLTKRIKRLAEIFIEKHARAIDETFYARTVDYNMLINETATVITVPYNAYIRLIAKLRQRITVLDLSKRDSKQHCEDSIHDVLRNDNVGPANEMNPDDTSTVAPLGDIPTPVAASLVMNSNNYNDDQEAPILDESQPSDQAPKSSSDPSAVETGETTTGGPYKGFIDALPKAADYSEYSAYDLLGLLYNSSIHVSATQAIIIGEGKQRSAAAVTGLLYDYATFARRFFATTSMKISSVPRGSSSVPTATICQNEEGINTCPTQCGYRNDSVHCFLIDNNGFIVVSEELNHIGRHLAEIDSKLLASLVADSLFYPVDFYDYQAVCIKPEDKGGSSSATLRVRTLASIFSLEFLFSFLHNLMSISAWIWSSLCTIIWYQYAMTEIALETIGLQHQMARGAVDAQLTQAQTLLSILPNKTTIKPCEKEYTLFETRPNGSILQNNHHYHQYQQMSRQQQLHYQQQQHQQQQQQQQQSNSRFNEQSVITYTSNCECDHWYVYDRVPKTNLIMLIMKSDPICAKGHIPFCELKQTADGKFNMNPIRSKQFTNESADPRDTICVRLEREANLYRRKLDTCISYHSNENKIGVCGSAFKSAVVNNMLLGTILFLHATLSYFVLLH